MEGEPEMESEDHLIEMELQNQLEILLPRNKPNHGAVRSIYKLTNSILC